MYFAEPGTVSNLDQATRTWLVLTHDRRRGGGTAAVTWAVAFTAGAALLCVAAVFGLLGIAHVRLSGSEAIERDGLAAGVRAPAWSLPDEAGRVHTSPPQALQLVVFADHSVKSFPSVIDGVRELAASDPALEIVLLLRQPNTIAGPLLRELGLGRVAVLTGSPALYARYNVRIGPFLIFVASDGLVRASSLVNYGWQVAKLRQIAGLPVAVA